MAEVGIRSVDKIFGSTQVLYGIELQIEDGEFVVLVGPSGCGKSTLLRMIAGLEQITRGDIEISGQVVNNLPPKDRDVAMVFQNYALYPHMTVFENMGFSLRLRRATKDTIQKAVDHAADILGLRAFFERFPRQLSGGQRQRVAMGRAIVRDPRVFLFDEPLSNLDAKLRVQMRTEIKGLHQRLSTTSVYVTHDQVEAMTMADRIVVMSEGRVEQIGGPLEVYDRPMNTFVASFIGSPTMNFYDGVVRRANGSTVMESEDGTRFPLPSDAPAPEGTKVRYGVRPVDFDLAADDAGVPATVSVVEPTGAETLVFSEVANVETCAQFVERHAFAPGQEIRLTPLPDRIHLFSAETGRRL